VATFERGVLFRLDLDTPSLILDEQRAAWMAQAYHTLQSDPVSDRFARRKLQQAVDRLCRHRKWIARSRLLDLYVIQPGEKHLDTHQLFLVIEQRPAYTVNSHPVINQMSVQRLSLRCDRHDPEAHAPRNTHKHEI